MSVHDATHHIDDQGCIECQRREHVMDGVCWCGHGWKPVTQREVLAAEARPAPDGPRGMTTRQTLGRRPRVTTPEAAPEVSAPALGRRLPTSDAASAAAASAPGRAVTPPAGGRGAEPPDELTLRYQFGDK